MGQPGSQDTLYDLSLNAQTNGLNPATLQRYATGLANEGIPIVEGSPGTFWQTSSLRAAVRRPDFCLRPPSEDEVRRVLRRLLSPVATYVRQPDVDHPQNAWLYVCENQQYDIEKLGSAARRDIRRALRAFRFSFIDEKTLLEKGERCYCDTRKRVMLSDGTPEVFEKTYRGFCNNPAHKILGAWAGESLAAYLALVIVDDWLDIFPYAADEHLRSCANSGLIHVCLDYFLVQRKFRLVNYGLSSIQEVSKAQGLHVFKKKVGFEALPVHRVFVFNPLLQPFANHLTLVGLRACRRLWPHNPSILKATGLLATYLGKNPMPDDTDVASSKTALGTSPSTDPATQQQSNIPNASSQITPVATRECPRDLCGKCSITDEDRLQIASVRAASAADLPAIVKIHLAAFDPRFTLSMLGPGVLRTYYDQVLRFDEGYCLVVEVDGTIVGFVSGFLDPKRFYRLLVRRKWQYAISSATAILRHPYLLPRLLHRTLFPFERLTSAGEKSCELSSLAVHPRHAGRGLGGALVAAFVDLAKKGGASSVTLTTDATHNEAVNTFYSRLHFQLARTFVASEGRLLNEYSLNLRPTEAANEAGAGVVEPFSHEGER